MPQSNRLPVRPKKVVLFPEIYQMKISLSLIHWHSQMYIKIYLLHFKKTKKQKKTKNKKKKQEYKEAKETREKNRISPENRLKEVNLWLPG